MCFITKATPIIIINTVSVEMLHKLIEGWGQVREYLYLSTFKYTLVFKYFFI